MMTALNRDSYLDSTPAAPPRERVDAPSPVSTPGVAWGSLRDAMTAAVRAGHARRLQAHLERRGATKGKAATTRQPFIAPLGVDTGSSATARGTWPKGVG